MKNLKILSLLLAAVAVGVIYSSGCGSGVEFSDIPSELTVEPASTELLLSWRGVDGASSYNIYWGTSPDISEMSPNKIEGIEDTSYLHTGLRNGTRYYYVVTGISDTKESAPSDLAYGTPVFSGEEDFEIIIPMKSTPPWGDIELRILADSNGFIYLMVQKNEEGLFEVYKYNSDGKLERGFGENGKVSHGPDEDGCLLRYMEVNSRQELVIVAACGCQNPDCEGDSVFSRMYRYLPSGKIDSSFGEDGIADGTPGHKPEQIKFDENDDMILAGRITPGRKLSVAKYSDAGKELWVSDDQESQAETKGQSILIDEDGNIIVAYDNGVALDGDEDNRQFIVWKMDARGKLIKSFSKNGRLDPEGYMTGMLMKVDSENRITTNVNTAKMPLFGEARILRYSERGLLDKSFGGGKGMIEMDSACATNFRPSVAYLGALAEYGGKFIGIGGGANDFESSFANLMGFMCIFNEDGDLERSMFEDGFHYGPPSSFPMWLDIDSLGRVLIGYQVINPELEITEIRVLRYK
ncbi:MAG: fibronectin type III domain-containing protein [Myxococcales bacterium]|nr:fibronectin type III domain-containing protein [Myxococcales bacterium]